MSSQVRLRVVYNNFTSSIGSHNNKSYYEIIVQNLAHDKKVSIWANNGSSWRDIPANFVESLPGNLEKWEAIASENDYEFAAKYVVKGITYWDNNKGRNYKFPRAQGEFNALNGHGFPILFGDSSFVNSQLKIHAAIQNVGYNKVVGLEYTVDNWATQHSILGQYFWTMGSGIEVWRFEKELDTLSDVEFAFSYKINGCQYWDNNFGRNYIVSPKSGKSDSDNPKHERWGARPQKIPHPKPKKVQESIVINKIKPVEPELLPAG
jgi:hypothetical protein